MNYRCANPSDVGDINTLVRHSKSYWGYSESFIDAFMEGWGIDEVYLVKNRIMLLENRSQLMGLYSFKMDDENKHELSLFCCQRIYRSRNRQGDVAKGTS